MGVRIALVPEEEAFEVDGSANLKSFNCLINVGILAAKIGFNAELIGCCSVRNVEVKVTTLFARAIPVVKERNIVAIGILVLAAISVVMIINGTLNPF